MWDESLFRDPDVLEIDYVPEQFEFRDTQMRELAFQIKPGSGEAGRSIPSARDFPVPGKPRVSKNSSRRSRRPPRSSSRSTSTARSTIPSLPSSPRSTGNSPVISPRLPVPRSSRSSMQSPGSSSRMISSSSSRSTMQTISCTRTRSTRCSIPCSAPMRPTRAPVSG